MIPMKRYKAFLKKKLSRNAKRSDYLYLLFDLSFTDAFFIPSYWALYWNQSSDLYVEKSSTRSDCVFLFFCHAINRSFGIKRPQICIIKRLYTSPMKTHEYILGYLTPSYIVAVLQSIVILLFSFILSLILKDGYFSFGKRYFYYL